MTEQRERTCEERIGGHLASRLEDFGAVNSARFEPEELTAEERATLDGLGIDPAAERLDEAALTYMDELPLSVSTYRVVRIDLSTGGPADWFEVSIDSDGDVRRIEYVFQDWFDGARRTLEGDEFETARDFLASYVEYVVESEEARR